MAVTVLFLFISVLAKTNPVYWQQYLHFTITAELNTKEKTVTGFETILYKNQSPDTLQYIWFHLYPNAYRDQSSALFEQLRNVPEKKSKLSAYKRGSISQLNFSVDGEPAATEAHPNLQYIDIVKVLLPHPLLPGDSAMIATPFEVKLPTYFSRSGFSGGQFMVCQWYPKPAVYDTKGWHPMPYLDMGEFYSEYASYNVTLTVPSDMVIAATGVLQTEKEQQQYRSIGKYNNAKRDGNPRMYSPASKHKKSLVYLADTVPDFAFFADKSFVIEYDTLQLSAGKTTDVFAFHHNTAGSSWRKSTDYIKDAVRHYSRWIGEYRYPVVQAVEGPKNNSSGGMEYPMITLITAPNASPSVLDNVLTHEVGAQLVYEYAEHQRKTIRLDG